MVRVQADVGGWHANRRRDADHGPIRQQRPRCVGMDPCLRLGAPHCKHGVCPAGHRRRCVFGRPLFPVGRLTPGRSRKVRAVLGGSLSTCNRGDGGEGGIRTPDGLAPMPHFSAVHSTTLPPLRGHLFLARALDDGGPSRLQGQFARESEPSSCWHAVSPRFRWLPLFLAGFFVLRHVPIALMRLTRRLASVQEPARPAWGLSAPVVF